MIKEKQEIDFLSACESGDNGKVSKLLEEGINPNKIKKDNGWSALMRASYFGNETTVKILLENGANPNHLYDGDTVIYEAISSGNCSIVRGIIAFGGEVNHTNESGNTPLHHAIFEAALNFKNIGQKESNRSVFDKLSSQLDSIENYMNKDFSKLKGLSDHVFENYLCIIKTLLENGAYLEQRYEKYTPVEYARYNELEKVAQLIESFIEGKR